MKCPRCVQNIHRSASQCPHCGFAITDLDAQYGSGEVRMQRLNDVAGVLRLKERLQVRQWMDQFEKNFPQLFFSVHYAALDEMSNIRQYGMWLLNHAVYEDIDIDRQNNGGVLLVVDVNSKVASISYGYLLDAFLTEEETFNVLAKVHPHLLQGNHMKALGIIISKLSRVLRKKARKARRNPKRFERLNGMPRQRVGEDLQRMSSEQASEKKEIGSSSGSVNTRDEENVE